MSLSNEQLLLLDALAYYEEFSDKKLYNNESKKNITVCDFVKSVKENKEYYYTVFNGSLGYSDKELGMDKIINLIDEDETLKSLEIVYPSTEGDETTSSVCLVNPNTSDVYVIYVGNYAIEEYKYTNKDGKDSYLNSWIENAMGAVEADTDEQKRELDFYEEAIAAARKYLKNEDGDLNITVSGHSAGGNHAQYVTTVYENYMGENYKKINDIDRCVSFDGQGFSSAFLEKYSEAIDERADKITSYCPSASYVGSLMFDIPGIEHKYIDIGVPETAIIGYHMPAELINSNGDFKTESLPSMAYILIKVYSTSSVGIAEKLLGVDMEHAAEGLGEFLNELIGSGDIGGAAECITGNTDTLALIGALTAKVIYDIPIINASQQRIVQMETINEVTTTINEVISNVKNGEMEQAIKNGTESIYKISYGMAMYSVGMATGLPIRGYIGFNLGWHLGKKVYDIYDSVYEKTKHYWNKYGKPVAEDVAHTVERRWNRVWASVEDFFGLLDHEYAVSTSMRRYIEDPLVIDLDGDGFELTTVKDGVYFDNDNKGLSEKTQWVSSDDGLLAIDLNSDGLINDGSELFGTSTRLSDGTYAQSGFEALSQYDDNGDGVIDENDKAYSKLLIWQDKNCNGISETDELKSLKEMGIKSISLKAEAEDGINSSLVHYADGRISKAGEFSFDSQLYNTEEKKNVEIAEEIKKLPDIHSIGNVASLHTLMQQDSTGTLAGYVNEFAMSEDENDKESIVKKILYFITGADKVAEGSRGSEFDAGKLTVIEAFMGRDFMGTEGRNPVNTAVPILEGIYNNIFEVYYNLLNGETALKDYLGMVFVIEYGDGKKYFDTVLFDEYMKICSDNGMDIKGTVKDMGRYILAINHDNKGNFADYVTGYSGDKEVMEKLKELCPDLIHTGTNGNEWLFGDAGDEIFDGGKGNDVLVGGEGNDIYIFNRGDGRDTICDCEFSEEEGRSDRIVLGEGIRPEEVSLSRSGNSLVIKYGEGDVITVEDAYRYGDGRSLIEVMEFSDGTVWDKEEMRKRLQTKRGTSGDDVMHGGSSSDGYSSNETFLAGAGNDTVYAYDGEDIIHGGEGNDVLDGGAGNDTIYGEEGEEWLFGGTGEDILNGGKGNDVLVGGEENDTYVFNRGDGRDTICDCECSEEEGRSDRIVFGEGIRPEEVSLSRSGNNLVINYGEGDVITVEEAYRYGDGRSLIEIMEFSDGTIWDKEEMRKILQTKRGTSGDDVMHGGSDSDGYSCDETFLAGAGNDTVYAYDGEDIIHGGEGNDVLDGGAGNDTIYGEEGEEWLFGGTGEDILNGGKGNDVLVGGEENDTYVFNRGDGRDTICDCECSEEEGRSDRIVFGEGIRPEEVSLSRSGNNLVINYGEGDVITVEEAYRYGDGRSLIEIMEFSDGKVWDKEEMCKILQTKTGTSGDDVMHGGSSSDGYSCDETFLAGAGNDTVYAYDGEDIIHGGEGNDVLDGGAGNDTIYGEEGEEWLFGGTGEDILNGGKGNDVLYGGYGNDTYIFGRGYDNDTITDDSGSNKISFNEDVSVEDLSVFRNGNNLEININDTDDSLIINNYFLNSCYQNFTYDFTDGTSLDGNDISSIMNGTYVYETTFKQAQLLADELAAMGAGDNVSNTDIYSDMNMDNSNTQMWVSQ